MNKIGILALLITSVLVQAVTFKGQEVTLNKSGLNVGNMAPQFMAVDQSLKEVAVAGKSDKIQIVAFVPSLDTGVCKLETIAFNEKVSNMKNVVVKTVSKDLPFAIKRFCHDNKITNVITLSDYKDSKVALSYGTTITAPKFLEGFFARVVYVVNTDGKIVYKEVVKEIATEPDYDALIKVVNGLGK